jgi:hypothetical protein
MHAVAANNACTSSTVTMSDKRETLGGLMKWGMD